MKINLHIGPLLQSASVHIATIAVFLLWQYMPAPPKPKQVVWTHLVQKGKARPKDFLPRKSQPQPQKKSAPVTHPQKNNTPTPKKERLNPKKEANKPTPGLSSALSRLKKEVVGDPNGNQEGDSEISSAQTDLYIRSIVLCLQQHYIIEGISRDKLTGRSVGVFMKIKPNGTVVAANIQTSSGIGVFDRAVLKAVSGCRKLDPVPRYLQKQLAYDGIEVTFTLGGALP
jgi:TonB family protein